ADLDNPNNSIIIPSLDYILPRRIRELISKGKAEYKYNIRIYFLKEIAYREIKK
ncbi:hypothetical protein IWW34DRAFT_600657, partial [Fusarium oxysporum f. sp. albedinis]